MGLIISVNIFSIIPQGNINAIFDNLGNIPLYTTYADAIGIIPITTYLICLDAAIDINEFCKTYNCNLHNDVYTMKILKNKYNNNYKIKFNFLKNSKYPYVLIKNKLL